MCFMASVYITHTQGLITDVLQLHYVLLVMTCTTEVNTRYDEELISGHSNCYLFFHIVFQLQSHIPVLWRAK